jgi:hypothetical protein
MEKLGDNDCSGQQRIARRRMLADRFADAVHLAAAEVEKRIRARNGKHVREEDL